jgi:hypothetical protein
MKTHRIGGWLAALVLSGTTAAAALRMPIRVTVDAGAYRRVDVPVSISLPAPKRPRRVLKVFEVRPDRTIPVPSQYEYSPVRRLCWILAGTMPAGGKRVFELRPSARRPGQVNMDVAQRDGGFVVLRGNSRILRYNREHVAAPKGVETIYGRSGYLHPLWSPRGALVTDDFPPDHLHQDGVWLAFPKTTFEGRQPDFWNLKAATGRVRCGGGPVQIYQGPVFAGFRAHHEHVDLTTPGGKVALTETWNVRVWNVDGPEAGYWLWDLTTTIRCATDRPVLLPEYHYGGLALRGGRTWYGNQCRFLTSEGTTRKDGNHTRARWCDMAGARSAEWAGITVLTHPANFRFPEPVRIHPTMPYMCFTASQVGDWRIEPGKELVLRYRFVVHDGTVKPDRANRLWRDFAEPPRVQIMSGD